MLTFIYSYLIIATIILLLSLLFKRLFPSRTFNNQANMVIDLYNMLQAKISALRESGEDIGSQAIIINSGNITFRFVSLDEALEVVEKMSHDALAIYDRLLNANQVTSDAYILKQKLVDICYQIRIIRWQNNKEQ